MAVEKAPPKPKTKAKTPEPVVRTRRAKGSVPLDPSSPNSQRLAAKTEGNLSTKQRDRADTFISQYLRDFNATRAFIRTQMEEGKAYEDIDYNYAMNQGYQMTRWPYVAQKIQEAMETAEEKNIISRSEVLFGLKREANYNGPSASHGARVNSWGKLAQILGMETKKIEQTLALKGGVMIVPETQDLDSWEARTQAAQAALKEEVRK